MQVCAVQVPRAHWLLPWVTEKVQVMTYGSFVACFQQLPAPVRSFHCIRRDLSA